jgi:hypothetical protein
MMPKPQESRRANYPLDERIALGCTLEGAQ